MHTTYPLTRLRRNRKTQWLRDIVAETILTTQNLILPIFLVEGKNQKQEIKTLPNIFRYSIDKAIELIIEAQDLGIKAVALFPSIDPQLKTENADEAYNNNNLICRAIREIKSKNINIGIICDVALDQYTISGHDGIINNGDIDNDLTIQALAKQSITLAESGADIIAPSDMMDGRVKIIRQKLDDTGFKNINILSYAAKYNSIFYSPFRDAVKSNKKNYLTKETYQMDLRNSREAIAEIRQDIIEGADMIMIKPAMLCLDIINNAYKNFDIPIFAYQVTGEYAMLKIASQMGSLCWEDAIIESLISCRRAGATSIFSYAALEVAYMLKK